MSHVPLCFNCNTREVSGEFSFPSGEGFCSAECEREAHDDIAAEPDAVYEGEYYDSMEAHESVDVYQYDYPNSEA